MVPADALEPAGSPEPAVSLEPAESDAPTLEDRTWVRHATLFLAGQTASFLGQDSLKSCRDASDLRCRVGRAYVVAVECRPAVQR